MCTDPRSHPRRWQNDPITLPSPIFDALAIAGGHLLARPGTRSARPGTGAGSRPGTSGDGRPNNRSGLTGFLIAQVVRVKTCCLPLAFSTR